MRKESANRTVTVKQAFLYEIAIGERCLGTFSYEELVALRDEVCRITGVYGYHVVMECVGEFFGIAPGQLFKKGKGDRHHDWKRACMLTLCLDEVVSATVMSIGRFFGCHHSSVSYNRATLRDRCSVDAKAKAEFEALRAIVRSRMEALNAETLNRLKATSNA